MAWEQSLQTCRFCKESDCDGTDTMVKYGVRHYAHYRCYLDAGRLLSDLHDWQIVHFPLKALTEFGLLDEAQAAQDRIDAEHGKRNHGRKP